jgi:hypothetical protein
MSRLAEISKQEIPYDITLSALLCIFKASPFYVHKTYLALLFLALGRRCDIRRAINVHRNIVCGEWGHHKETIRKRNKMEKGNKWQSYLLITKTNPYVIQSERKNIMADYIFTQLQRHHVISLKVYKACWILHHNSAF